MVHGKEHIRLMRFGFVAAPGVIVISQESAVGIRFL